MDMAKTGDPAENMIISFMMLRRFTGITGTVLPVALLMGCCIYCQSCRQPSISDYYHSEMRDILVGVLFAIAVFLLCYRGYSAADQRVSIWAGVSALGVAIFETDPVQAPGPTFTGVLHYISAVSFFAALICFCLFLFTRTDPAHVPTGRKLIRNKLYRVCGYIMLGCVLLIPVYGLWLSGSVPMLRQYNPVFWLETFALWAFGISWIVKGEMILADKTQP